MIKLLRSLFRHKHRWITRVISIGAYDLWYEHCECGGNRLDGLDAIFTDEELNDYINKLYESLKNSRCQSTT
jgi:hypothetical protein